MKLTLSRVCCLLSLAIISWVKALAQETPSVHLTDKSDSKRLANSIREAARISGIGEGIASANNDGGDPQSGRRPQPQLVKPENRSPKLTLDELIKTVDLYHPKLRGADLERKIAAARRLEKQGAFDPVFTSGTDYLRFNAEPDDKTPRGKPNGARVADAGVEFLTRSGIKIGGGVRLNLGKVKSPLSPTGDGGEYFIELKIPLLRDWRINDKSAAERRALLEEPIADTEFQATRLDLLLKAALAYWDWVSAAQKLEVARNLLALAEFRARGVRDRVNAGDLPQIDIVEADLEVRRREGGVVKADRDLQKASFKLSLFLWLPDGAPAPIPRESEAPSIVALPVRLTGDGVETGMRMALERRPELRAIGLSQEINRVDLDLARNQRRPAVEMSFSPGRDTGLGSIGATMKAGVSFTFPIRQRVAEGRISAAVLKRQKLSLELINERQRIANEVLDAASAINTTADRHLAVAREVELSQRLEQAERDKFTLGDSTLFLVNQRERAAAEARIKLIELQAEYQQAIAAFRAVTAEF